jgi:phosphohistidine phosphatase
MAHNHSLYLVRHAVAADRGEAYPDDWKRPLTPQGMTRFRAAVRGLVRVGVDIERVLCSPLVRARQTADILSAELPGNPPVSETDALEPGAAFERVLRALDECADSSIALVGHEPGISDLAAQLMHSTLPLEFKKGAVCRIDMDGWRSTEPGRLRWFLPPKIMRKLAD